MAQAWLNLAILLSQPFRVPRLRSAPPHQALFTRDMRRIPMAVSAGAPSGICLLSPCAGGCLLLSVSCKHGSERGWVENCLHPAGLTAPAFSHSTARIAGEGSYRIFNDQYASLTLIKPQGHCEGIFIKANCSLFMLCLLFMIRGVSCITLCCLRLLALMLLPMLGLQMHPPRKAKRIFVMLLRYEKRTNKIVTVFMPGRDL